MGNFPQRPETWSELGFLECCGFLMSFGWYRTLCMSLHKDVQVGLKTVACYVGILKDFRSQ